MVRAHVYLVAIIDWYSRFIVGRDLSDVLDASPALDCVKSALERHGVPSIINSDHGCQFTSDKYMNYLYALCIMRSMDGKGRWADNVVIDTNFK
jgi:putative transposase